MQISDRIPIFFFLLVCTPLRTFLADCSYQNPPTKKVQQCVQIVQEYISSSKTPDIWTHAVHCAQFTQLDYNSILWQWVSQWGEINAIEKYIK